jgi:hypothetical protein
VKVAAHGEVAGPEAYASQQATEAEANLMDQ